MTGEWIRPNSFAGSTHMARQDPASRAVTRIMGYLDSAVVAELGTHGNASPRTILLHCRTVFTQTTEGDSE